MIVPGIMCELEQLFEPLRYKWSGLPHALSFSELIYFLIGTVSTVGYGDITPYSSLARVLASLEVFCGIMLLLFGVSELLEYARELVRVGVTNRRRARAALRDMLGLFC